MSDSLLHIRNLVVEGKSGGDWLRIVNGINLTLARGEVLGLVGESGAGKSTLGLAAMGHVHDGCRIASGSIRFDGIELVGRAESQTRLLRGKRIAYVAQSAAASFNPAHRLITQYAEAPVVHGVKNRTEAEADAVQLFEKLRLPEPHQIGFRYPHQVSGGQLQRAMTAMAMSCRPDLIIFDEPTTALDVTTQIGVLAAIRDVVRELGTAAIYITHDLAVVAQMADRIKVLLRGEEVEEAPTAEILGHPREAYTKSLWAVRNIAAPAKPNPSPSDQPHVRIAGITAAYGAKTVLKNVTIDLHRGRTVAVVGESGSGKSTVARVVAGLLEPKAGEVILNGQVLPPRLRLRTRGQLRQVQMIYQMADTALNPKQRIGEIIGRPVAHFLGLSGAARRDRVRDLLRQIDLEPDRYIDRFPSELSGGQKQRVGIARALAAEPSLIICDEVTSALDQIVAEAILKLLQRLQSDMGLTYMFITHDLETVRAIADDVVVMHRGEVVEAGPRDTIFAPPHPAYTELLLNSVPRMDPGWLTSVLAAQDQPT